METVTYTQTDTIRVVSEARLNRYKKSGVFNKLLRLGYIFNNGCKRFTKEPCTCNKCIEYYTSHEAESGVNTSPELLCSI